MASAKNYIRHPLDRFDLLLLAGVAALSLWTLGLDLWQVAVHGRIWTGTEAVYQEDGMQSLMWLRGILEHGASPDLYVLAHTSADFFQPLLAVSAGVAALGVAPYVALLLWKPVALLAIFFLVRAYVHRLIPALWPRRAALTLALLYGWGQVIGDSWIVFWTWGYPFALIALACMVGALLAYSRARAAGRVSVAAALLGMLASWLHPWQGETLIVIVVGVELALLARRRQSAAGPPEGRQFPGPPGGRQSAGPPDDRQSAAGLPVAIRRRAELAAPVLTVALTALPLLYFALLVHFDPVWQREREAALSTYPVEHVVTGFVLLALPALLAYRTRVNGFLELTARVWPAATVAIFALSEWQGSGSTHALLGVTIPLGVLAVQGVCTLPWPAIRTRLRDRGERSLAALPALAVVAIAVLIVPGTLNMLKYAQSAVKPRRGNPNFIAAGESRALSYLAHDPRPGGVLTRFYLGMVVPAQTGRRVYTGNCYWSQPSCRQRSVSAEKLLTGEMPTTRARAFVRDSGARYVLADCRSRDLMETLAPIVASVHRFGCAAVYVIG